MPLINVMRAVAMDGGLSERDFDVAVSAYLEAGTLIDTERAALVDMTPAQRVAFLAAKRYPPDALIAVVLDFDAHGYLTPGGEVARFHVTSPRS
jgi:hypothetical protein